MNITVKNLGDKVLRKIYRFSYWQNRLDTDYQLALTQYARSLPVISNNDLSLVETLKQEGVVITSLESLGVPYAGMLQAAKKLMSKIPIRLTGHQDEFDIYASSQQLLEYPNIFYWGLEQRLLNIIENYIGLPVAYYGPYFRKDIVNNVETKSRLWHIDFEDRKMIKIIIYLNPVDNDGGYFQYLPKLLTSRIAEDLKYKYESIEDKTMQRFVLKSNYKSCTGDSGTLIFADTCSIFHRGKIPVNCDRFAIFFYYTSRQPLRPLYCNSYLEPEDLCFLSRQLSEHQKQYVSWH